MGIRIVLLAAAAALACTPELKGICTSNSDCKAGEHCSDEGLCLRPEALADGGNPDSGNADAGNADAGTSDAGNPDSGTSDAGPTPDGGGAATVIAPADNAFVGHVFGVTANASSTDSARCSSTSHRDATLAWGSSPSSCSSLRPA